MMPIVEQPSRPSGPTTASSVLAAVHEPERQPERASSRSLDLAPTQKLLVSTVPKVGALGVLAEQICGRRESLEIVGRERRVPACVTEVRVRLRPRMPVECLTSPFECVGAYGHVSVSSGGSGPGVSYGHRPDDSVKVE